MNFDDRHDDTPHCSFCGKHEGQVRKLITARGGVLICDQCVELCKAMIDEELAAESASNVTAISKLPKPKEIKEILDEYVIGQEEAKRPYR